KPAGPGAMAQLFGWWNRILPWPFTLLGLGCAVAGLSLAMQVNEVPGAPVFFALAAVLILGGLVGLFLHTQKEEPHIEIAPDDAPRELKVYKKHDCTVTAELTERFAETEVNLLESMHGQGVPADFDTHAKLAAEAEAAAGQPDPVAAFRARC